MLNKGLFSSDKDDWETPQKLFEKLNDRYHFVIDLAATSKNAKCKNYYTVEDDALSKDWSKVNGPKWLNPPYGRQLGLWVKKAYISSIKCKDPIVLLIPARTDTSYWTKEQDGALTWARLINKDYMIPTQQFTLTEIEHYGLQDCEKEEVTDDDD